MKSSQCKKELQENATEHHDSDAKNTLVGSRVDRFSHPGSVTN